MLNDNKSLNQQVKAYEEIDWDAVLSGPRVQASRNDIKILSDARQRVDDALGRIETPYCSHGRTHRDSLHF